MLREALIASLLVTVAVGLPFGDDQDQDLNFVLRNITAIWEELQDLRQEINHHMHEGHEEINHDQALQEVETLHHEHHVHHLHHPHEGHNEHHDKDLLRHLTEVHGHMNHHGEGPSAHGHGHSHGHEHGYGHEHGHGHDHSHGHGQGHGHDHHDGDEHDAHDGDDPAPHENEDIHDTHGMHSHEDDHEYSHEKKTHKTSSSHQQHHHHHKGHSDANFDDDDEDGDGDDDDDDSNERPKPGTARRPDLALIPGRGDANAQPEDPWMYATCALEPNVDMPESHAKGTIVISQRKDKKGPVFFDLHLEDVDVSSFGRIHGFHVHEKPVTGGSCGSTGGHFNPAGTNHGAPEDDVRHVGDLGNIEVDENGELHGHIISDRLAAFQGPHGIVGKALVLHAGEDDMGKGGYADSLTTGHAGARLACCTIHIKPMTYFRFKG